MTINLTPPFTAAQERFLAVCPKFTSSLSIIGSIYIVQHILRSPTRRQRVYTRLLLGMTVMDLIYACKNFLSTWPLPVGTALGAVGTVQTCTAAGFLGHGGSLSSAIYNGSLTLYYLLTIRQGWTQTTFRTRQREWVLHFVPLAVGWGTAIAGLPLTLFNPIGWTCWIGPSPITCPATGNCVRGANAKLYRWIFFHAILWATFAFVAIAMVLIYLKIRTDEKATEKYSFTGERQQPGIMNEGGDVEEEDNDNDDVDVEAEVAQEMAAPVTATATSTATSTEEQRRTSRRGAPASMTTSSRVLFGRSSTVERSGAMRSSLAIIGGSSHDDTNGAALQSSRPQPRCYQPSRPKKQKLSRRFAEQAFWYILAFFIAWIWPMAQFAVTNSPDGTIYYPLMALTVILNPLQGMFNALIYIRPRYLRYRDKQREQQQQQAASQSRHHQRLPRAPESANSSGAMSNSGRNFMGVRLQSSFARRQQRLDRDNDNHCSNGPTRINNNSNSSIWDALVSAVSVAIIDDDDEDSWERLAEREHQLEEADKNINDCVIVGKPQGQPNNKKHVDFKSTNDSSHHDPSTDMLEDECSGRDTPFSDDDNDDGKKIANGIVAMNGAVIE